MQAKKILSHLDRQMAYGSIPILFDNANLDLVDARMTVFRSNLEWVVFFEIIYSDVSETDYGLMLWAYSNCFGEQGVLEAYGRHILDFPDDMPFWSSHPNEQGLNCARFSILLRGERFDFTPTQYDYLKAGIALNHHDPNISLRLVDILRFVAYHLNHPFFASEDYLRYIIDMCKTKRGGSLSHRMKMLLQTREWQHPHIPRELPSQVECFRTLARIIETGNPSLWNRLNRSGFNTNWRYWEIRKQETENAFHGSGTFIYDET